MRNARGMMVFVVLAAALVVAVGCFNDDDDNEVVIPNLAGQYDLNETLAGPNNCELGDPMSVPVRVEQTGSNAVLINGTVPGPDVCGAQSEGTVTASSVLPAAGDTVFPDYWSEGCDLIQTNDWNLTVSSSGDVTGTWTVSYSDAPADCSGVGEFLPCTNDYDVAGTRCEGCFPDCSAPVKRAGGNWGIR